MWRSVLTRAMACLCLLALQGCGSEDQDPAVVNAAPTRGGTAVMGSLSDVDTWNEYTSAGRDFANGLHRRLFLRLAQVQGDDRDHPPTYAPLLASAWQFSEDGLSLTFTLNKADWSDGQPITAGDVQFTWRSQTSTELSWGGAAKKSHITAVEVVDAQTVTFHFDSRYPFQLADAVEGGIIPEHSFGKIPYSEWLTHDWSEPAVVSGPFMLERHDPGQEIVLKRNPHYMHAELPLIDRLVIRVGEINSLLAQLEDGQIDYLEGLTPRDAHALTDDPDLGLIGFNYPKYDFIAWNGARAPFGDPDFRRALTMAIDRDALTSALLYGYGRISTGPVLSFSWGADPALSAWPYDPDIARDALNRLGYGTLDASGAPVGSGEPLKIELLTNLNNRLREDMLVNIQQQLSKVGIEVSIRKAEFGAMIGQVMSGEYDGFLGGWVHSSGVRDIKDVLRSDAARNVVSYHSERVDQLLDRFDQVENWQAMKPEIAALQQQFHQDQPYSFLYELERIAVHGPRLQGVRIDIPSDPLARLEHWWVRGR
jgi:peptide/nickel transport system substrate-binding protein